MASKPPFQHKTFSPRKSAPSGFRKLQFEEAAEGTAENVDKPSFSGKPRAEKTSWEPVAKWYTKHIQEDDNFQTEVIFPGALRLLGPKRMKHYLDIACGEGSFAREITKLGGWVVGIDISPSLVKAAEKKYLKGATFRVANANDFARYYQAESFDGAVCVMAIQNIEEFTRTFEDAAKLLKPGARFVIVMNHPVFRIARMSGWGWDEKRNLQYRRIDAYMTGNEIPITSNPGRGAHSTVTYSYHRPLQDYIQALAKVGFTVDALEEWTSHRQSDSGPRAKAENRARNEIPMFMAIRAIKT